MSKNLRGIKVTSRTVPNQVVLDMDPDFYEAFGDYYCDFVVIECNETMSIGKTPFFDADLVEWQETTSYFRDSRRKRDIKFTD